MNVKEAKVYFRGILANVDSSILQLNFNYGFKIESFSEEEAITIFSKLEKIPEVIAARSLVEKYFLSYRCLNDFEQRIYTISNSFDVPSLNSPEIHSEIMKFDNTVVVRHLEPIVRLMRLFKEGDIRIPVKFYYLIQNGGIQEEMRIEDREYVSNEPYHLEASEIPILQSFVQSVQLPFRRDFLHLAFENFELSYRIQVAELAFLVLMIGLETLFNPSENEVRHRISRNMAVLLGEDRKDSKEIFIEAKRLYKKRSDIVHSGKRGTVKREELLRLRDYLRKAIKEIHRLDKKKPEIMDLLDSYGLGEGNEILNLSAIHGHHR
jgi:hypothetical protein